jgi:hypothetical protein
MHIMSSNPDLDSFRTVEGSFPGADKLAVGVFREAE